MADRGQRVQERPAPGIRRNLRVQIVAAGLVVAAVAAGLAAPPPPAEAWSTSGTTVAGGNGPGSALNQVSPTDVAVDSAGNLYVLDALEPYGNGRVLRFPPGSSSATSGVVVAGGNGVGSAANQFNDPRAIVLDASGNLFVSDRLNYRVLRFPPGSTSSTNGVVVAGGNGEGTAANQFKSLGDLALDGSGNLYVLDALDFYGNGRVQRFPVGSTQGTSGTTVAADGTFTSCGLAVDPVGSVYVSSVFGGTVQRFPAGATATTPGVVVAGDAASGSGPTNLNLPCDLALDASNNLYVSDTGNHRVQRFPAGSTRGTAATTVAGGNGSGSAANQLDGPTGLVIDDSGNLLVGDVENDRVQKWLGTPGTPTGVTAFVSGPASAAVVFTAGDTGGSAPSFTATCVSSDGGTSRTGTASASPVTVTTLSVGKSYTCSVEASNTAGSSAASASSPAFTAESGSVGGRFVGITPTRALDTREDGPCVGTSGRTLTLAGVAGVPADASAVALNVTVVSPSGPGFVTVWPNGEPRPTASNLNYVVGQVVPNMVQVKLGTGGAVRMYAHNGCPNLVVDVAGFFTGGPTGPGGFEGITPVRALDTREDVVPPCVVFTGGQPDSKAASPVPSGIDAYVLVLGGEFGVPADAVAVALNVTVVSPSGPGFVTVWPAGAPRPTASNLNYVAGQVVPNMVQVKLGAGGAVSLFANNGCPDVVVDVTGYFTAGAPGPGGFVGITPVRVVDSRPSCLASGTSANRSIAGAFGIPANAAAVVGNMTAVTPWGPGFLTLWPTGAPRPVASNVNYVAGEIVPNMAQVKVGTGGSVSLYSSYGCPAVVLDVMGYYLPLS